MGDEKKEGLKSAFDLAMDRLAQKGGALVTLTPEQKTQIAEVGQRAQAKIAEVEILFQKRIADARGSGGEVQEKVRELEANQAHEIAKIRERTEAEKQKIRDGK